MMKITGLSHLFKWENLHNWWLTKYFFAPLYIRYYYKCLHREPKAWLLLLLHLQFDQSFNIDQTFNNSNIHLIFHFWPPFGIDDTASFISSTKTCGHQNPYGNEPWFYRSKTASFTLIFYYISILTSLIVYFLYPYYLKEGAQQYSSAHGTHLASSGPDNRVPNHIYVQTTCKSEFSIIGAF